MRACKVDANHKEICDALVAAGCTVQSLAKIGNGCPDAMASRKGKMWLFEFKHGRGKTNELQSRWHLDWQTDVHVVYSAEEALRVIGK